MTDQELLFLLEHDPEAGIHELMQMYGGAIYTICKNFLADCPESDIEETVADTYIHFWKYRNRFVPDENHSVKSYLYSIARNAARDRSIFIYRYFYGFKIKQIAEIIKQPQKKIENILFRGKEKLRIALMKGGISRDN